VSWLNPRKVRSVTIVGSKKMVVCDDLEDVEKIRIYDKGVTLPFEANQLPFETDRFQDFHLSYRYGGITIPHVPFEEPLRTQCEHFLDCIRTGRRPQSDGRVGLKVVRLLEAADRSLHNSGSREPLVDLPAAVLAGQSVRGPSAPSGPPVAANTNGVAHAGF
jgi:predicted dehydrogenase